MTSGVLIAGGGLAAQRCCETLRKAGYDGAIRLVCGEPHLPYDRPPLSKEVLTGSLATTDVAFRSATWYEERGIELLLGRRAVALDPAAHELTLDDGTTTRYGQLLIATGSEPRRLELLADQPNVHYLRTVDDARGLHAALRQGTRLVVVGAGFIGQEVAATARGIGAAVTMLEALPSPLSMIFGEEIGGWFATLHQEEGVDVRCSVTVAHAAIGSDGRVTALVTGDGHEIACDEVVVGIGVRPADTWLYGTGLGGGHVGVEVDEVGRTTVADVYAAGDVARPFDPRLGAHVRTEHWEAAARLGAAAAGAMLGLDVPTPPMASFWSNQYGIRFQYLGYAAEADAMSVDGDPQARDYSVVWTRDGRPVAALIAGRPREISALRSAIEETFESISTSPMSRRPAP